MYDIIKILLEVVVRIRFCIAQEISLLLKLFWFNWVSTTVDYNIIEVERSYFVLTVDVVSVYTRNNKGPGELRTFH